MDKWLKDILPDKDPYHNRGRDQIRKKGGSGIQVPVGLSPDRVKPKTIKLVFVASPLSTQ